MWLSIVIASHNAADVISACLGALQAQRKFIGEIIVADNSSDGTDEIIREHFPEVTLAHFTESLTLPQLRGKAIATTCGDIIAILDPYSIVDSQWAEQLIKEHQARSNLVIGGTVDLNQPERQNLLAWAKYINEYGMFMSPMSEGAIEILPGSNISYKRVALFDGDKPKYDEFWKTFVNENIEAGDSALWLAPRVLVYLNKPISFLDFLQTRFDHGRCFAGMRVARASRGERCVRALAAPILPLVFIWRWGMRYWSKQRYRGKFLLTLPLQLILFGNWALGEMVGYLRGVGKSCQKLYY